MPDTIRHFMDSGSLFSQETGSAGMTETRLYDLVKLKGGWLIPSPFLFTSFSINQPDLFSKHSVFKIAVSWFVAQPDTEKSLLKGIPAIVFTLAPFL